MLEQGRLLSAREAAALRAERDAPTCSAATKTCRTPRQPRPAHRPAQSCGAWSDCCEEADDSAMLAERAPYACCCSTSITSSRSTTAMATCSAISALRAVADAVTASIRKSDVAVRYGGEEFLVVLPGTRLAGAAEVAQRIRARPSRRTVCRSRSDRVGGHCRAAIRLATGPSRPSNAPTRRCIAPRRGGRDRIAVDDTPRFTG